MKETYEEMYREYAPRILAFTTRLVCEHELAEDMTQETFLHAWRGYERLHPESNTLAWLYRIARNVVIDSLRKKRVTAYPLDEHEDVVGEEDMQEAVTQHERVYGVLAKLPPHYQQALLLSYVEEHSERAIAEQLGVSRDVIRSRLMRGRAYFRACYLAGEEEAA